ncbi:uncharacterized protein LOC126554247 [Aphis gossypii]|uniref:uncharacterized protein LOC114132672 n=1 Tax=Aphis gossypii TaxID=80765 RepID=UPI002158E230|nr:uncharacterized protein LOC114132672 [Aphis gossypii]XP_050065296.1 uncharacterized protein LOC126554247 [Aphis gossypii]
MEITPTKRNRQGKIIHTCQKEMIINLYKDLMRKEPEIRYEDLLFRLSEGSGIGIGTIKKTLREYKSTGKVSSPKNKKLRSTICEKLDDFDKNAIRQKIHQFWFRKEIPTLAKIIQAVQDDPDLPNLSRSSFQRLLKDMQFEYTKRNRNSALTEREDLVLWRRQYISQIRRYRQEGRTIYYLDETWVNVGDCSSRVWVDKTVKSHKDAFLKGLTTGARNPTGKGKRLIVFCSILPKLNDNAVIILDNAPYHSVKKESIPTTAWTKARIQQWLESKGVVITEPLVKIELLQKVKQIKNQFEKYVVDEEAKKQNKTVLRLPPYHCELNPIELAWSVVKGHVKTNNTTFKLNDVRQLLIDGIQRVTPEMWSNFISHTIKEEDKFWQIDFISDDILEENESQHVLTITGQTTSDDSD